MAPLGSLLEARPCISTIQVKDPPDGIPNRRRHHAIDTAAAAAAAAAVAVAVAIVVSGGGMH